MEAEAYSARMHELVLQDLRQASLERLAELASYFRRRDGPGRALVAAELHRRLLRRQTNYPHLLRT